MAPLHLGIGFFGVGVWIYQTRSVCIGRGLIHGCEDAVVIEEFFVPQAAGGFALFL